VNKAFELLGLPMDADAASIKRAYARLLRSTRPDDDPEGFQRLHAAYKAALAFAERPQPSQANAAVVVTASEPVRPPVVPPEPESAAPSSAAAGLRQRTVDINILATEVIRTATETDDSAALAQWLQGRSEFWSIMIKQQTGNLVMRRLFQQPQAIAPQSMDSLLQFFDLDHVLAGINTFALQQLRSRQQALWEIIPRNHAELACRIGKKWGQRPETVTLGQDIALLQQPFSWFRVLRGALQLGRDRELVRVVQALSNNGRLDQLPPSIDRQHAQFWLSAAAPGGPMSTARFALGSWRAGIAALGIALFVFAVLLFTNSPPGSTQADIYLPVPTAAITAAGIFGLWLAYAGSIWFDRWQAEPESAPTRWPWLRRFALPALCALGFTVSNMDALHRAEWPSFWICMFAARRFSRRTRATSKLAVQIGSMMPSIILAALILGAVILQDPSNAGISAATAASVMTLCLWLADMWRHVHLKLVRR
jgi:hypothetical protein